MMSLCSVRGCRSAPGGTDSSVTFHPFPAERGAAERWARLCGVSDQECSKLLKDLDHGGSRRFQICSLHFEEQAFETNPEDETCNVRLRPGAEPTLLLSPVPTAINRDQVNPSWPAAHGPQRRTPPPASSCSSCARSEPQNPEPSQGPGCQKSSRTESRPQVSHCPSGATVVRPQPGVSQIVLNFSDHGNSLTLEDVSTESAPRCLGGGCCCSQRVVKQVVLILLDHPREPPLCSRSSQESSPTTLSSSTQTEGNDGRSKSDSPIQPDRTAPRPSSPCQTSHGESVHTGTQTEEPGTCMEVSEGSPGESPPNTEEVSGVQGSPGVSPPNTLKVSGVQWSPGEMERSPSTLKVSGVQGSPGESPPNTEEVSGVQGSPEEMERSPSTKEVSDGSPEEMERSPSTKEVSDGSPGEMERSPSTLKVSGVQGSPEEMERSPSTLKVSGVQGLAEEMERSPSTEVVSGVQRSPGEMERSPSTEEVSRVQGSPGEMARSPRTKEVRGVQGSPEEMERSPSTKEVSDGSPGEMERSPSTEEVSGVQGSPGEMERSPSTKEVSGVQGSPEEIQRSPRTEEVSGVQGSQEEIQRSPSTEKVPTTPGKQSCTSPSFRSSDLDQQTPQSILESMESVTCSPQNHVTGRQDVTTPLPPDTVQPPPEDQESEHGSGVDSHAQDTDDRAQRDLRNSDPTSLPTARPHIPRPHIPPACPHIPPACTHFCLDPSIKQYVGDLLEQYNVPPSPCISASAASSSSQCSCISSQHRVKKIVVNLVEQERAAVSQDIPTPDPARELSSPLGLASRQHQETQTCNDFLHQTLQRPKEKPKSRQSPPRPPQSQSCPPLLITAAALSSSQEEERSPAPAMNTGVIPQDTGDCLESKVTFEDVAVYFSKEEWELLGGSEKDLYREVMSDNYRALLSLGLLQEKPDLVLRIEKEEEDLWVIQESHKRIRRHCEEELRFLERDMEGARVLAKEDDTSPCAGRESVESSSHLGALMRLVNEIPGFLLGSSVTDGSCSPARSAEDHGSSRSFLEVKTEEHSPACSPASSHLPLSETPEMAASPGVHRITEQRNSKIVAKAEKAEVAVSQSPRYGAPASHLPVPLSCVKSDPGGSHDGVPGRLQIKQEEFSAHPLMGRHREIPPMKPLVAHHPKTPPYSPGSRDHVTPDYGSRRPGSGGGTPLRRSAGASPRNPSVSPASASPGANCTGLGDLRIKIKQEDSGSEREMAESPVYGRKVHHSPASSSMSAPAEREHWRLAASPLRSPADVPPGSSPLHRLVNCLKEMTAGRPRPYTSTLSTTRWGVDMSRVCADPSVRPHREPPAPNPFTVAVTNGAGQLRDGQSMRAGRDELHGGNVPLSALGKCLEKIQSRGSGGQNMAAAPNTAEPGVKRTHSDDLSCRPGVVSAKRPTLKAPSYSRAVSSCSPGHRDLWRPPEELPRAPSEDQPIGNSHLMSVMNCVRKIPGCRSSPSIQVASAPDGGRACAQGVHAETKGLKVKQERDDNLPPPPPETAKQWIQPPPSPDASKQPGPSGTNVHLTGLMRLMEEIPCTGSSSSSRTMYSIAAGPSLARRTDRPGYLSCNDDSSFQAELNDSMTIASVDSVYSDDTSWSSENVGPSYSAIGGLQRVVSEFAELGSVSPLVAVSAPPVSSIQDSIGLKKPKEASSVSAASTPRLSEGARPSPRDAVGVTSSACSAENGEAAFAAIRGLHKVVHGFVEQECVSPISAVRISTPNAGPRDCPGRKTCHDEEAASPHLHGSSPAPLSRFLCDTGKWLPEPDSSYSALSGLQKVVNGFSELSCVSPFSAVSTPVSEVTAEVTVQRRSDAQTQDCVSSTLMGLKNVINGTPDAACLSPLTVASNVSSESDAAPAAKRRCERRHDGHNNSEHSGSSSTSRTPSSHCIDLTQEEEPVCSKNKERRPRTREAPPLSRNKELPASRLESPRARPSGSGQTPCNQLIDLTEEDETISKYRVSNPETARKPSHTGLALNPPLPEQHRPPLNLPKAQNKQDKPLDPGASGSSRGAVPAVNEHLSGLEKLLKGVPTFTPASRPSGQQAWSGGWWFKSTSPHET